MSLSFSELILYLLPGFLGLWVYKRIVQEDIDERAESTQIAIGLLLGISGLCMLYLINMCLKYAGTCVKELRMICEYVSPLALKMSETESSAKFGIEGRFWISYVMLCVLSLISGGMWGSLTEKKWTLTKIMSRLCTRKLGLPEKESIESGLRTLINRLHRPSELMLARIYMLGENRDNAILGWVTDYSDTSKEIVMSRIELFRAVEDINKRLELQPSQVCVNYESGVVIEIYDWDKGKKEKFDKDIRRKYREKVNSPIRAD